MHGCLRPSETAPKAEALSYFRHGCLWESGAVGIDQDNYWRCSGSASGMDAEELGRDVLESPES